MDIDAERRARQTTGGRDRASATRRVQELERSLAAHSPAGATATVGADLLDYYLDETRPKNHAQTNRSARWSATYNDQVHGLVNRYLSPVLARVPLASWAPEHAYAVLDRCPTNYMVGKVRRTLSAVLGLGVSDGFLRPDQRLLHRVSVPLRTDQRPARLHRARTPDLAAMLDPAEVPTIRQVAALAHAHPDGTDPEMWEGLVNSLAYGGFRIGELLALSCRDTGGDIPDGLVAVRHQLIEPRGEPKRLAPPKNGCARMAVVCETTPLGFPLKAWLHDRSGAAALEQAAGHNAAGALFVTPRGRWWTRSNFRTRCFNPAALGAGWERTTWTGPVRRRTNAGWRVVQQERHDWRHPVHALRHHYACTARDVWGWNGAELCLSGGWADEAFVMTRYYGSNADTYLAAISKQRSATTPGTRAESLHAS